MFRSLLTLSLLLIISSSGTRWQRHGFCYDFEIKIEKGSILTYRSNGLFCVFGTSISDYLWIFIKGRNRGMNTGGAVRDKGLEWVWNVTQRGRLRRVSGPCCFL